MTTPRPIRLLQVIPRFAPAWRYGGGVRFNFDLDQSLVRAGHQVTVFTSDQLDEHTRAGNLDDDLNGIKVRRFRNASNYLASTASWLCFRPNGMRRALLREAGNYEVIHVAEARGPHVRWAFAAARALHVPVVWSPLGGLAEGVGIRKPYRTTYDVVYRTRRLVADAHVLVAQSPHEAALFESFGASRNQIRCIGLGVDARFFQELPPRGLFRHGLGVEPDDPMILFVGRLHPTKGLDVLLKASAIVKETLPRLKVVLIGWDHGALRTVTRLSRSLGLSENVRVLPPVFDSARLQAYVDADVFAIAATTYEETSLAALEALASGTCCVLSHQCEVPGFGEDDGVITTACEPQAFAQGLLATLTDSYRRARALTARRSILAWHTTQSMAAAHAALFQEVATWRRQRGAAGRRARLTAVGE